MTSVSVARIARINAERTIPLSRYQEDGFENRWDYLFDLAEQHGVGLDVLLACLDFLPPSEDFDGLVSTLEDAQFMGLGD